ncbi:MAG: ArsR family transcriptional regulator [Streptococcaceae bacterium]|jgi:DNA-binding transcriptional ArsR family regulator|nr:ArsR family transcriptional regulator [Streptococcaceae bacterium]
MSIEEYQKSDDEEFALILQAIGEPTRLAVLRFFSMHEETAVADLNLALNLSDSLSNHHRNIIHQAGLCTVRKEGRQKFISLNRAKFEKFLPGFLEKLKGGN